MKKVFALTTVAVLWFGGLVQANVFNLGTGFTNLETVPVGDPGNAADTSGYGSVGYAYHIGKYEVTAKQYADFLNHKATCNGDPYGLYNTAMAAGCNIQRTGGGTVANPYIYTVADDWANRPVNYVSFLDACRFANWLGNGQGDGNTEDGAYTLWGYTGWNDRRYDGGYIYRNDCAKWAVTSEDEWYKAAYYKAGGIAAGYWDYPTQSDISMTPSNDLVNPDPGNNANFSDQAGYTVGAPYYRTNVGEFVNSESAYGTFDQGGNVWEWNEAILGTGRDPTESEWEQYFVYRGWRGGSFSSSNVSCLQSSYRHYDSYGFDTREFGWIYRPVVEASYTGFRVSEVVPGPVRAVRISDLSNTPLPPNPIKVWGTVTSASPMKIGDGTIEIPVSGLAALPGDFVVVTCTYRVDGLFNHVLTALGPTDIYISPAHVQMVRIPAGHFLMGNNGDEGYSWGDEHPQHSVVLPGYYVGKYEITRGEYRVFMNAGGYSNPSYWSSEGWSWRVNENRTQPEYWDAVQNWGSGSFTQTDNHPVVGVSYYEAEAFCSWAGGRLPTEAEWEKAARWTGSYPNVYPWANTWDGQNCNNWFDYSAAGGGYAKYQTAPVGSYPGGLSPYGCHDMAGNALEWCQDWTKSYPGSTTPFDNTNVYRALRGGAWNTDPGRVRCAYRSQGLPSDNDHSIGFRLAR